MGQLFQDAKLVLSTDKRIWAGAGFVCIVVVVWALTDSWRPPPEVIEERTVKITEQERKFSHASSEGMVEDLSGLSEANDKLKSDINRISEELHSKQEEISWQMDGLISRLGSINSTIDDITQKVGAKKVEDMVREQRQRAKKVRGSNSR